jgi:putative phosphoesterase
MSESPPVGRARQGAVRLGVMADVHGNLPALEAVLEDMARHRVDQLLVAGDLVGGPQPNEVMRRLQSRGARMILGNSDRTLLDYQAGRVPAAWRTCKQFALLRWSAASVNAETLSVLQALPEQRVVDVPGTVPIRVVHGSPRHVAEHIYPRRDPERLDEALAQIDEPVLVCGHTHEPWVVERDGRLALNPGAVCGPLDGFVGAQWALLTWRGGRWQAELRGVRYDLERVRAAFRDSGLLAQGGVLARAYVLCLETGHNVWGDFLTLARRHAQAAGLDTSDVIPDEAWDRALAQFDWQAAERLARRRSW